VNNRRLAVNPAAVMTVVQASSGDALVRLFDGTVVYSSFDYQETVRLVGNVVEISKDEDGNHHS
jgi:hypothetical protein